MIDSDDSLDWQAHELRDETAPGEISEIDLADIDRRNGWVDPTDKPAPDIGSMIAALERLVDMLAGPRICKQGREASGLRVYALQWALQRGDIGTMTMSEAAEACKVTVAAFSLAVRSVSNACGLHWRGQRRESAREAFRAGARRRWDNRPNKKTP